MNESLIAQSVFFDEVYYRAQLSSTLPAGMTPASHYLNQGWHQGLDPGPLFSTLRYLWRNEDVRNAGLNPLLHYLHCGLSEGRRAWSSPEVMRWQQPWFSNPELALAETQKSAKAWPTLSCGDKVVIYSHSQGHFVFRQFQEMLVQAFQEIGIEAIAANENLTSSATKPVLTLVLAPHYGLMQGNCVVTESSPRVINLTPGVDYIEAKKDEIPSIVEWLLESAEGKVKLGEVRLAGQKMAIKKYNLGRALSEIFRVHTNYG